MLTRFGQSSGLMKAAGHIDSNDELDGVITDSSAPGGAPLYAPPVDSYELKALRSEITYLRQVLYHKATYSEERDYYRWKHFVGSISTSKVAGAINTISTYGIGRIPTKTSAKVSPQFLFRLVYSVVERVASSRDVRWEEKPSGLSKLKWLWQNNLLFLMPFAINAFEALFEEMLQADPKGTTDLLNKMDKHLSKKNASNKKP